MSNDTINLLKIFLTAKYNIEIDKRSWFSNYRYPILHKRDIVISPKNKSKDLKFSLNNGSEVIMHGLPSIYNWLKENELIDDEFIWSMEEQVLLEI
jgi:hypothetical protein